MGEKARFTGKQAYGTLRPGRRKNAHSDGDKPRMADSQNYREHGCKKTYFRGTAQAGRQ